MEAEKKRKIIAKRYGDQQVGDKRQTCVRDMTQLGNSTQFYCEVIDPWQWDADIDQRKDLLHGA